MSARTMAGLVAAATTMLGALFIGGGLYAANANGDFQPMVETTVLSIGTSIFVFAVFFFLTRLLTESLQEQLKVIRDDSVALQRELHFVREFVDRTVTERAAAVNTESESLGRDGATSTSSTVDGSDGPSSASGRPRVPTRAATKPAGSLEEMNEQVGVATVSPTSASVEDAAAGPKARRTSRQPQSARNRKLDISRSQSAQDPQHADSPARDLPVGAGFLNRFDVGSVIVHQVGRSWIMSSWAELPDGDYVFVNEELWPDQGLEAFSCLLTADLEPLQIRGERSSLPLTDVALGLLGLPSTLGQQGIGVTSPQRTDTWVVLIGAALAITRDGLMSLNSSLVLVPPSVTQLSATCPVGHDADAWKAASEWWDYLQSEGAARPVVSERLRQEVRALALAVQADAMGPSSSVSIEQRLNVVLALMDARRTYTPSDDARSSNHIVSIGLGPDTSLKATLWLGDPISNSERPGGQYGSRWFFHPVVVQGRLGGGHLVIGRNADQWAPLLRESKMACVGFDVWLDTEASDLLNSQGLQRQDLAQRLNQGLRAEIRNLLQRSAPSLPDLESVDTTKSERPATWWKRFRVRF